MVARNLLGVPIDSCGLAGGWSARAISLALLSIAGVVVTLTLELEAALSQSLESFPLPTSGDAFRILPGNKMGLLMNNKDGRYFIVNLESRGVEAQGVLDVTLADIAVGTEDFVYLVGTTRTNGGSGVIARLNWKSGVVVSRQTGEQWDAPSVAVARWVENIVGAESIVVGNRRSSTLKRIPASFFDNDALSFNDLTQVYVGYGGVDELEINPNGRYAAAVVGDGSELVLVDLREGRVMSRFNFGRSNLPTVDSLANAMKMVVGTGKTVNSLTLSILYGLSGLSELPNMGDFVTFDVNEIFNSLDLVQSVQMKLAESVGERRAKAVAGRRPVVMLASDEEQKLILVGDSGSNRLLRFERRANEFYSRRDIPLNGLPMDIDVSTDGETAVILQQDEPVVFVLRSPGGVASRAAEAAEGTDCVLAEAQGILARQGYSVGAVDGKAGPQTIDAIQAFQAKVGSKRTGQLDERTLDALRQEEIKIAKELTTGITEETWPPEKAYRFERLGFALEEHWDRTKDPELIDEVLAAYRQAAELSESADLSTSQQGRMKNNLCFALAKAGKARSDLKLIDEAIDTCRSALGQLDTPSPPWAQHSLGFALLKRYELAPDPKTLAESADYIHQAIDEYDKKGDSCVLAEIGPDWEEVKKLQGP